MNKRQFKKHVKLLCRDRLLQEVETTEGRKRDIMTQEIFRRFMCLLEGRKMKPHE